MFNWMVFVVERLILPSRTLMFLDKTEKKFHNIFVLIVKEISMKKYVARLSKIKKLDDTQGE